MPQRIALNSKTSGGFKLKKLNGRDHIVTNMIPIVGDSVMNGIFYPDSEVNNSFAQLNNLPAPNGHPQIGDMALSAFHPVATNAFNVGGFIRSPKKSKKVVKNQLWLDVEIANQSEDGRELIRRIKASEKIGVSTGLNMDKEATPGVHNGKSYNTIGRNYQFDHVALLLNEIAAGDHEGTEIVFNAESNSNEVFVCNLDIQNELSTDDLYNSIRDLIKPTIGMDSYVYVVSVYPESKTVIYEVESPNGCQLYSRSYAVDTNDTMTLLNDVVPVMKKVQYEPETTPVRNNKMSLEEAKQVVADAGLVVLNAADHESLTTKADSVEALNAQIAEMQPIVNAHVEAEKVLRDEAVGKVVGNSEMTAEDLAGMSVTAINSLAATLGGKKTVDRSAAQNGEIQHNSQNGEDTRQFV